MTAASRSLPIGDITSNENELHDSARDHERLGFIFSQRIVHHIQRRLRGSFHIGLLKIIFFATIFFFSLEKLSMLFIQSINNPLLSSQNHVINKIEPITIKSISTPTLRPTFADHQHIPRYCPTHCSSQAIRDTAQMRLKG